MVRIGRSLFAVLFALFALSGGAAHAAAPDTAGLELLDPQGAVGDRLELGTGPGDDASLVAGYFTNLGPRRQPRHPVSPSAIYTPSPVLAGFMFTLGSHIPFAGDVEISSGRREFTPTFDLGGSFFLNFQRIAQVDFVARGGFGGVSSELYEDRYQLAGLESRHIWLGVTGRFFPVDLFGVQPYVSVSVGGDRVMAVRREPNGEYTCTDSGYTIDCEPDTERVFAAGYWGSSIGYGGGLRIEPNHNGHFAIFVDVQHVFNRYGRRTNSAGTRERLGEFAPRIQEITANAGVAFNF